MSDLAVIQHDLLNECKDALSKVSSLPDLNNVKSRFLGKKSLISKEMQKLSGLLPEQRKELGHNLNSLREKIISLIGSRESEITDVILEKKLNSQSIDVTLPGVAKKRGKIHPLTKTIDDAKSIMHSLGFAFADGPEIEDEQYNFTALNIPKNHPARQMHDTFYCFGEKMLLRTHTSPVQIRHLLCNTPPVKIIAVGKVYRSDYDATHTPMFHQVEGLWIDKNINLMHLKSSIETFLKLFFQNQDLKIRFRVSYFPFTEPSFEVDMLYEARGKKQWLEVMGCGIVHKNVLKNAKVGDNFCGFAFGMGVERLAMIKYGISDLRAFFENDCRFVAHYSF